MSKLKVLIPVLIVVVLSVTVIFINISAQHRKHENIVKTETVLVSTEPTLGQFCNIAEVQKKMFTEYWNTHGLWCFNSEEVPEFGVWTKTSLDDADPKIDRLTYGKFSTVTFESRDHDYSFKYPKGYTVKEQTGKEEVPGFLFQAPRDRTGGSIYSFSNAHTSEFDTALERQKDDPLVKILNYTNPLSATAQVVASKTLTGFANSPQFQTVQYTYYFIHPKTGDMLRLYGGGPDSGDPAVNLLIDSFSFKK